MSNLSNQSKGFVGIVTLSSGMAVTTTLAIADGTGNEHASVILLTRKYLADLEEFGVVDFKSESSGGRPTEYAVLNEQQATLILTYMRNSEIVRKFKIELVREFWQMAQRLSQPEPQAVNPAHLSRIQLIQIAMEAEEERLLLEAKVEEQTPKVEALERISEAEGAVTLTNAAKILQQQPRKFNDWLHSVGWIYRRLGRNQWTAYQHHIQTGRLTHKVNAYIDSETGESKISEQVMITPKGIAKLSEMLNFSPTGGNPPPAKPNAYLEARG